MRKKRFFVINYPTYIVCENEKGYTFFQKIFSIFLRASRIFEQNKKTPPGEPDGAFDLDLRVVLLDSCLSRKRYITPTISYPHTHIQIHPLIDSTAGRKAVDRTVNQRQLQINAPCLSALLQAVGTNIACHFPKRPA